MNEETVGESGWDQADEWSAPPWFNLSDGENAKIVILTAPQRVTKTISGKTSTMQRVRVLNIGAQREQDWDCGFNAFEALKQARSKHGDDLSKLVFMATRSGTAKQTRWTLTKLDEKPPVPARGGDSEAPVPL